MTEAFSKNAAFTLTIAAAMHDATPAQRARLAAELRPEIEGHWRATGDGTAVRAILLDVLGPEWAPSGDYLTLIRLLVPRAAVAR